MPLVCLSTAKTERFDGGSNDGAVLLFLNEVRSLFFVAGVAKKVVAG